MPRTGAAVYAALVQGWVRSSRLVLVLTAVTVLASSFALTVVPSEQVDLLTRLVSGTAALMFCTVDARVHGKTVQRGLVLPLFMTWPLAVGVHLVWTRGKRGALVYLLAALVYGVLLLLGSGVAQLFV